jgi:Rha family phage regulatory protein
MDVEVIKPNVENRNGILVVTSRTIAKQLGKEHKNVVRDLDGILKGGAFKSEHTLTDIIISSTYINQQNLQKYREYLLTEDGFTLYMFSIQGYVDFKMDYIKEFKRMRDTLSNPLSMLLAMDKEDLALATLQLTTQVKERDRLLLEQKPKVEFADKMASSEDSQLIRTYAKMLYEKGINIGEKKLYAWLIDNGYLNEDKEPFQKYMKYFELKPNTYEIYGKVKCSVTTRINTMGQIYFYNKLKNSEFAGFKNKK